MRDEMATIAAFFSDHHVVGGWNLVPALSSFTFSNKTIWGLMTVKGQFAEVRGDGQVTDTGAVFGRLDITAASLYTGNGKRDSHLRSADFFDVEKFPAISVVVTAATPSGGDTSICSPISTSRASATHCRLTRPSPCSTTGRSGYRHRPRSTASNSV
jgi:polyisoprenoid-binding protein YceI